MKKLIIFLILFTSLSFCQRIPSSVTGTVYVHDSTTIHDTTTAAIDSAAVYAAMDSSLFYKGMVDSFVLFIVTVDTTTGDTTNIGRTGYSLVPADTLLDGTANLIKTKRYLLTVMAEGNTDSPINLDEYNTYSQDLIMPEVFIVDLMYGLVPYPLYIVTSGMISNTFIDLTARKLIQRIIIRNAGS
jgi:hypothetical protein